MKIALLGYGKMGKLIEQIAHGQGEEILFQKDISQADVCIDFSHGSSVLDHVKLCIKEGKNLVLGTTGWENQFTEVKRRVEGSSIGLLYSSNFSIGVHLFIQLLERSKELLTTYDAAGVEFHHNQKKDAPSGTAKEIAKRLQIDFSSVRVGSVFGKHEVIFDSPLDTITVSHEAKSREGFALGALEAARWLKGKAGFFTLKDMVEYAAI